MKFFPSFREYANCVEDLLQSPIVLSMDNYRQHGDISCLQHSIFVSYISFLFCRKVGWDYRSAARGALLHDLFLYDWHDTDLTGILHGFTHPITALNNANTHFSLNQMEQDIIKKHMWPLVLSLPSYKESFVVSFADKYCAIAETLRFYQRSKLRRVCASYSK